LVAPKGLDVRPTPDRVREALFNILGPGVEDARVLDLYCGTGALAVEALSRGAATGILVDRADASVAAARENLERAGVADRATVVKQAVERYVEGRATNPSDLVFLDPPYAASLNSLAAVVDRLVKGGFLHAGATVVLERSTEGEEPDALGSLPVVDVRRYGSTRLLFARLEREGD